MKFSQALISIACAPSAMVAAMNFGNSVYYDRHQGQKEQDAQANLQKIQTLTSMGFDEGTARAAIQARPDLSGQVSYCLNSNGTSYAYAPNMKPVPLGIEDAVKPEELEPTPSSETQVTSEVETTEMETSEVATSDTPQGSHCINLLYRCIQDLKNKRLGRWVMTAASCFTQSFCCPFIGIAYCCVSCWDKTVEVCCCIDAAERKEIACIPEKSYDGFTEWLQTTKDAIAEKCGTFVKCNVYCFRNVAVDCCGRKSKIFCAPCAFWERCGLDWKTLREKVQKKDLICCQDCFCCVKDDCDGGAGRCYKTCCGTTGEIICCVTNQAGACVQYFTTSCCKILNTEDGEVVEGCAAVLELLSCCPFIG